ncbi:MAG TPA: response regulator [Candidatus Omnitrophota bacterium]|nr:response regulator [Candidatus Omnitrophota bacterium]
MPKKILIIDDEPEICSMVTEFLIDAGYAAFYALNGPEGLSMIEKNLPDLLLLDIGMPGMDGLELMREVHEKYPSLSVIVLTGHKDTDTVKRMLEYGVCEYLTKPINLETLLDQFVRDIIGPPQASSKK